jgi:peroxiredoxin
MKNLLLTKTKNFDLFLTRSMLLALILSFSNCAEAQKNNKEKKGPNSFTITGKISGTMPNDYVYYIERNQPRNIAPDTVKINTKDSTFSISGESNYGKILYVYLDQRVIIPMVTKAGSKQHFTIILTDHGIQSDVNGEGAESSKEIKNFLEEKTRIDYEIMTIENYFKSGQVTPMQAGELQEKYMELQSAQSAISNAYIARGNSAVASYFILSEFIKEPTFEVYEQTIASFEKQDPQSPYLNEVKTKFKAESATMIGALAPDIRLPNPKGDTLSLSSLRGKVVLIDFWASWCRPCRIENPNVKKVYDKFKDKGFEIFAVSLDGEQGQWESAIRQDGLPWLHVSDLGRWGSAPAKTYKVSGIPYTVLLDENGRILAKNLRGEALEGFLNDYFK